MQINISFSMNNLYAQHTAAVISSILHNASKSDNYKFFILTDDISKENKEKLESLKYIKDFDLEYIIVNGTEFKNINYNKKLHITAFYRFYLFNITSVDKLLYLDSDTIVRSNIADLFKIDIDNYCIAGVEDIVSKVLIEEYSLSSTTTYINSGVMLLNLKQLRKNDIFSKIKEFIKLYDDKNYGDQDIINYAFQNQILPLDIKWNFCYPYQTTYANQKLYHQTAQNPSIIHYITQSKPWVPGTTPFMKSEYFKYLKMTPWFEDFISSYIIEENSIVLTKLNNLSNQCKN